MNVNINNSTAWSESVFGNCGLGDKRLTRRLLQISNQLLNWQNISLSQSCDVEGSQIEGSYRFIRNERFTASQIASVGVWSNSKRTGKASWATIWNGWSRLNKRVEGFILAQEIGVIKM